MMGKYLIYSRMIEEIVEEIVDFKDNKVIGIWRVIDRWGDVMIDLDKTWFLMI